MNPIDKLRAWLAIHDDCAEDGVILGYASESTLIRMRDLRSIIAEHDRLTAELASAKLIGAAEELETQPCLCKTIPIDRCPLCDKPLDRVYNTGGVLNDEQFDSVRAGDFYCSNCSGAEAKTGYKYWWSFELQRRVETCARCKRAAELRERAAKEAGGA